MKKSFGATTMVFPSPVWVIGSYDKDGKANMMTVAWGGICSSRPPCLAVSIRKATYTHANIIERKAFTINVVPAGLIKEADYFGIASGRNEDKLAVMGLNAEKAEKVDAPYIKEFPMIAECKLVSMSEIGIHTQFIGEIIDVKAEESVLGMNGMPDMGRVNPALFGAGVNTYHGAGNIIGKAFSIGKRK